MTEDIKADAENVMKRCQIGTKNYNEANNLHAECYGTIGRLLLQVETLSRCLFQMQEAAKIAGAEAEKQEPVAWVIECEEYNAEGRRPVLREIDYYSHVVDELPAGTKLYTHPQPKREWVGLTDEEIEEVERWVEFKEEGSGRIPMIKLVKCVETKLKEKNT